MSIKEFDILLLNSEKDNFYKAGGTLQGKIVLVFGHGKRESLLRLRISFNGKAKNQWQEENQDGELVQIEYEEQYLNFDADVAIDDVHLSVNQERRTEYGFEYELSKDLPSSFEGAYGSIFYEIVAVLEGTCCHTVSKQFFVKGIIDLNQFQELGQPSVLKSRQELLFGEGSLGMEGKLQKVGFVPGESVILDLKLFNESKKNVQSNLFLLQETCYYAKDRKVSDVKVISSMSGPKTDPNSFKRWNGSILQVPEVPLSSFNGCSIIDIQYRLVLEMEIPGPNINLEVTIPIVIGSVPVKSPSSITASNNLDPEEKELLNKESTSRRIKPRQSRSRTTCLVFRPERPKLKLPTPNPESWPKPKKQVETVNVSNLDNAFFEEDINSDELIRHVEELVLDAKPSLQDVNSPKPKWPAAFVRRRKNSPKPIVELDNIPKPIETVAPIQKHSETRKRKDLPQFPGYDDHTQDRNNVNARIDKDSEKETPKLSPPSSNPPYPLTGYGLNFPVPDFSFNIQENGKCSRPIGWNVTRNTLSLRRAKVAAGICLPLPTVGWSADP